MKGVSAVIAIILILMIVVALAALAWTWFSGIFSTLTETAETSIVQTTEQMAQNFVLESVWCDTVADEIEFTIRNTGTNAITADGISAYIAGEKIAIGTFPSSDIGPGEAGDYIASRTCAGDVGSKLRATIPTGLAMTRVIE
jgi:FlaG/FlaF family flagellin (archaellin)